VIVALMAFSRLGHLWSAASAGRKGWHQWGSTEVVTSAGWTSGATYENIMNHMVHDYQCEVWELSVQMIIIMHAKRHVGRRAKKV
jgi:hypothetical protein